MTERDGIFQAGKSAHNHAVEMGAVTAAKIISIVKSKALELELLDREAKLTTVTIRLVSDNKLKRIQRKVTRNIQAKLFSSWEKYENNEKTAAQLLKTCSRLNGPARAN